MQKIYTISDVNIVQMNNPTIILNGNPYSQKLSVNIGPYMISLNDNTNKHQTYQIVYPTTHSIPGPYLRSYINPGQFYSY